MSYEVIISPYYNNLLQNYENILVLNQQPPGPLKDHVKRINIDNLSAFETFDERNCVYALTDFEYPNKLLSVDNVSQLLTFFNKNNYSVDYQITKLIKKEVSYNLFFLFSYN